MQINISGDGEGFDVSIKIRWRILVAFLKAMVVTILVLMALLSSPAVARLESLVGW